MPNPAALPLEATVTMTIEHFASKEAEVVVTTAEGHMLTQAQEIEDMRDLFRPGRPVVIEADPFLAMGYSPA